jgi:hypothetical protein
VELERVGGKQVVLDIPNGFPDEVWALTWSRDGRWLAIATGSIVSIRDRLLDLRETVRLEGHAESVTSVAISPDGKTLASSSHDGSIRYWTSAGYPSLVLRAVVNHNASYAFAPGPAPLIEFLGPEAEAAAAIPICRAGALSFPFDLCRERFEVHGLFAKVLAGNPSYAEP